MIPDPILIVDDEAELRIPLRDALTADGYTVEDAAGAEAALVLVEDRQYPVVVTDLHMPGGPSGLDLMAAVKARAPRTLCIVITGYASLDVAIEALKRGAYDFVQKPFKLAEIEAVLDRALEHARLLGQLEAYQQDLEFRVEARVANLRNFQEEALAFTELLMEAQGQPDEASLAQPFLRYLEARYAPDGCALLRPAADGWDLLAWKGAHPWTPRVDLPEPGSLRESLDWSQESGFQEGHLVPLRKGERLLGALFLGFEKRSAFDPQEPSFILFMAQMRAAFHGLQCARILAAAGKE